MKLRRAGKKVSPSLEGSVRFGARAVRLIGVEPVTLPPASMLAPLRETKEAARFLSGEGRSFASPQTMRDLGLSEGARPKTSRGVVLPPLAALAQPPPGAIIVDIGVAQKALEGLGACRVSSSRRRRPSMRRRSRKSRVMNCASSNPATKATCRA